MEEILKDIFETEKGVEKQLQDAREHAAHIKKKTEQEVTQRLTEAKGNAREMSRDMIAESQRTAEREMQEILQHLQAENDRLKQACLADMDRVVDRIVEMVSKSEFLALKVNH